MKRLITGMLGSLAVAWLATPCSAADYVVEYLPGRPQQGLANGPTIYVNGPAAPASAPTNAPPNGAPAVPPNGPPAVYVPPADTEHGIPEDSRLGRWLGDTTGFDGHIVAGTGFLLLEPSFSSNPAYAIFLHTGASSGLTSISREVDFRYGGNIAPLAWVGYMNDCGLGARVSWWQYGDGDHQTITNPNGTTGTVGTGATATINTASVLGLGFSSTRTGDELAFNSNLRLNVWDFEAVQNFDAGKWNLLMSGGVRYASLSEDYNAYIVNPVATRAPALPSTTNALFSSHTFNGAGPTVAVDSRRRLGNTSVSLYGQMRGSVLFGTSQQHASTVSTSAAATASHETVTSQDAQMTVDGVLPIGELEVGAEYGYFTHSVGFTLQVGLVGQIWIDAGNASRDESILSGVGGTSSSGSSLSFFGLVCRAGFSF